MDATLQDLDIMTQQRYKSDLEMEVLITERIDKLLKQLDLQNNLTRAEELQKKHIENQLTPIFA